jgi:uncharacterized protein YpmS
MRRRTLSAVFAVAALGVGAAASQTLTQADATSLQKKLDSIMARGLQPKAPKNAPYRTFLTEREINAYFKFNSQNFPTGVVNPKLLLTGGGRLEGQATVDLTAIRKSRERSWIDPMNLVGGSVDLKVVGTLTAANGQGRLMVESASLGGVPIPKPLLQEVIAFYTKSPELPDGFDIDKPFPLPSGIREVDVQRGTAMIVQ